LENDDRWDSAAFGRTAGFFVLVDEAETGSPPSPSNLTAVFPRGPWAPRWAGSSRPPRRLGPRGRGQGRFLSGFHPAPKSRGSPENLKAEPTVRGHGRAFTVAQGPGQIPHETRGSVKKGFHDFAAIASGKGRHGKKTTVSAAPGTLGFWGRKPFGAFPPSFALWGTLDVGKSPTCNLFPAPRRINPAPRPSRFPGNPGGPNFRRGGCTRLRRHCRNPLPDFRAPSPNFLGETPRVPFCPNMCHGWRRAAWPSVRPEGHHRRNNGRTRRRSRGGNGRPDKSAFPQGENSASARP